VKTFTSHLAEEMKDPEFAAEYERVSAEENARCERLIELERAALAKLKEWHEANTALWALDHELNVSVMRHEKVLPEQGRELMRLVTVELEKRIALRAAADALTAEPRDE
jgi:hypothetical protein